MKNGPFPSADETIAVDAGARVRISHNVLRANWKAPSVVRALTTLRGPAGQSLPPFDRFNLGMCCCDDAAVVQANRDALSRALQLPSSPRWLRQVHGAAVVRWGAELAQGPTPSRPRIKSGAGSSPSLRERGGDDLFELEPEADAAVTRTPGVVLAILTADCLPVLFCDDDGATVAAAHAGWRGLAAGVLENTVAAMGVEPTRIRAWLGPAAGPLAYEVGAEVRAAFVDADSKATAAFVATRPGHWLCDLYALARLRLARAGVNQVDGGGLCTITDAQRFYSHRRDGMTGRMASLVWRETEQS